MRTVPITLISWAIVGCSPTIVSTRTKLSETCSNPGKKSEPSCAAGSDKSTDSKAPKPGKGGVVTIPANAIRSSDVKVSWERATDDGTAAEKITYAVFYSRENNISTVEQALANGTRAGEFTKNISEVVVSGLDPATTYYFTVVAQDDAGNYSVYSVAQATTAANSPDATPPTAGSFSNSSNITTSTITLNWSAGSDAITATASLQYYVCSGASAAAIDTVAECEAATQRMNWTANTLTLALTGLATGTTYYFNTIVRNAAGDKTVYSGKTESTSTLPSTTSNNAERSGTVRHSFYDTINARHWQFYDEGEEIKPLFSTNGATWVAATTLSVQALGKFSTHYKAISGTAYVFLVFEKANSDILLRRGILSTTSIAWDSAVSVFDGTSSTDLYRSPAVTTDDSNVWVAASKFDGFNWSTQVRQSSNASNGNLSAWDAVSTLGSASMALRDIALMHRGGGDLYALYQDGIAVTGYAYTSGSWALASTGGGNAWFTIAGSGGLNNEVYALAVSGNGIYAGGAFLDAGGNALADRIARWNGTSWDALGSALNGRVNALEVSGSDIYVGGEFTDAGGNTSADYLAKWNGSAWSAIDGGLNALVYAIVVSGSDIYVGGNFTDAGGNANADKIARWNGSSWEALGSGLNSTAYDLAILGSDIYVAGGFNDAGGNANADFVAKWTGSTWEALGSGLNSSAWTITISGSDVYVGGDFFDVGGNTSIDNIARWNGSSWEAIGPGLNSSVLAIAVSGTDVYAGGSFWDAGGNADADRIAKWNGSSWEALASGLNGSVYDMVISGSDVYLGGAFSGAGGNASANFIAKWNGSAWEGFSSGLSAVLALAISGSDIYAGGGFIDAGGVASADYIARWNGSSWEALGSGLNGAVAAIVISGSDIYAGGSFTDAGGNASADRIAKWNGSSWEALGSGLNNIVRALAITSGDIYAGGQFIDAGGNTSADRIAKWNGTTWEALGSGLNNTVRALAISGIDVYAAGSFTDAGGNANGDRIAKWNGTSWEALGSGLNNVVYGLASSGIDIYAGGIFTDAGGNADADRIARWNGSSWEALSLGLNGSVYTVAIAGTDVYAGGTFTDAGGDASADSIAKWNGSAWVAAASGSEGNFHNCIASSGGQVYLGFNSGVSVLKPGVATGVANFSAATSVLNEPVLLYTDAFTGAVNSKTYASGSWSAATTVQASEASAPVLSSVTGTSNLFGFWYRNGAFEYKRFDGSAWDASPTTLVSASPASRFPTCDLSSGGGLIKCLVTTLTTAPFAVNTWTVAP